MNGLNWTAIIVAIIALIGTFLNGIFFYLSRKKAKKPNSTNPAVIAMGNGQRSLLCMLHAEKLTKLEIKYQKVCDDIRDIKDDLKDIKEKMVIRKK